MIPEKNRGATIQFLIGLGGHHFQKPARGRTQAEHPSVQARLTFPRCSMDSVTLYRPTGPNELELVKESGYAKWPLRLPEQPIFYPVTNEEYAREIAIKWNTKDGKVGYVTKFKVKKAFMDKYAVQKVGGRYHTEWWIPAEDLEELNNNIVGLIEVIGEYK